MSYYGTPLEYLMVFDIETIPDHEVAYSLTGQDQLHDIKGHDLILRKRQIIEDYHLNITDGKNAFLRQPFHKVVAISYAMLKINYNGLQEDYDLKVLKSGGELHSTEKDLIAGFFEVIDKYKPRLVSFNGRTFDLPVLKYRAMKYGIAADVFFNINDKGFNYNYRYSLNLHCDLLEALSDFGSSARIKLNEVCSILGFPGKFGTDGSKVVELFDSGRLQEIRDYCETDVLNTYLVYLRYMLLAAKISLNNYNASIEQVLSYINKALDQQHLQEFKKAWGDACKGEFLL